MKWAKRKSLGQFVFLIQPAQNVSYCSTSRSINGTSLLWVKHLVSHEDIQHDSTWESFRLTWRSSLNSGKLSRQSNCKTNTFFIKQTPSKPELLISQIPVHSINFENKKTTKSHVKETRWCLCILFLFAHLFGVPHLQSVHMGCAVDVLKLISTPTNFSLQTEKRGIVCDNLQWKVTALLRIGGLASYHRGARVESSIQSVVFTGFRNVEQTHQSICWSRCQNIPLFWMKFHLERATPLSSTTQCKLDIVMAALFVRCDQIGHKDNETIKKKISRVTSKSPTCNKHPFGETNDLILLSLFPWKGNFADIFARREWNS